MIRTKFASIVLSSLAASALTIWASTAAAESSHGPLLIQGGLGFSDNFYTVSVYDPLTGQTISASGSGTYSVLPSVEFLYHFSGSADGFNIGVRQEIWLGYSGGIQLATAFRAGYDIAIPIKNKYELTIAPFGVAGISYFTISGADALFMLGFGAEARFYFSKDSGFFVMARPIEIDGFIGNGGYWGYQTLAGVGFSF
jgi:hypothetical protein